MLRRMDAGRGGGPARRVRLLGPLEVTVDATVVDLGGPRQRSVLALLLVAHGEVVSVDRLIDDLWRGEPPTRATGALQAYVSNLRRILEPDRAPRTPSQVLVSAAPGYAVRFAVDEVDAWDFDRQIRAAAELSQPRDQVAALEAGLSGWRGPALAEFAAESWAQAEAARLEELRLGARERLVEAQLRAGAVGEAVIAAQTLIRDRPLREEGWRLLAVGQYTLGRQGEALASLRQARTVLAEELGIDPGPRLAELEQNVLAQRVELVTPPVVPSADRTLPAAPAAAFVGRDAELAALLGAARRATSGTPALALIAGEAGGGKSALLGRLRQELLGAGWRVVVGRCPESAGWPPAWAWTQALQELATHADPGPLRAQVEPLLSVDTASTGADALESRLRLHRGVGAWLAAYPQPPLAVLLDDLHLSDAETRALLASLVDHRGYGPVLFALAYRPNAPSLDDLLGALARHGPTRVRLDGLDRDEIAAVIGGILGAPPEGAVVDALTERTDGNPFYVIESARLLASEGHLVATSQVPEGVADVLRRRFARLPEETVSTLRLAAVIGRDVDAELLIASAELDEEAVLDALEAGVISGLLVEPTPGTVRFSHLLVRETLYAGVPALRRRRWHARVAEAVAELYPADLTALAHHTAQAATPTNGATAAALSVRAAQLAESRYAYDTAAQLYRQALRCLELTPAPDAAARVAVLCGQMRAVLHAGGTNAARAVLAAAIEAAETTHDDDLLVDVLTAWNVPTPWTNRPYGIVDQARVSLLDRLLRAADLDPARRAGLLCSFVRETSFSGDPRTEPAGREALRIAHTVGDPELVALALVAQAEFYLADVTPHDWDRVVTELGEVAERHRLVVFELLAHVLQVRSACVRLDLDAAHRHHVVAARMARTYQLRQAIVVTTAIAAMLAHLGGDLDAAEERYREAHTLQVRADAVDADEQLVFALITVRYTQGRLGELVDQLQHLYASRVPAAGDALALALIELGRRAEAVEVLTRPRAPIAVDFLWLIFMTIRGLAVAEVGDAATAAGVYAELLPYAGQVAGGGTSGFVLTPVARALGRLAHALGRTDDARGHFEQARAVARRCGSAPWLAQVDADVARLA